MMEEQKEKLVQIEPLPEPTVPTVLPTIKESKPAGRRPLTEEQKQERRIARGLPPVKDKITYTKNKKRALEKARVVKALKSEWRHENDDRRKQDLAVQINAISNTKIPVPFDNSDIKSRVKYQNPTYGEEGIEPSLLEQNPTLVNIQQTEESNRLYQWSNSNQGQQLWSGKLQELETKINALDNYLSKIRVLSGEGTAGDYGNPANIKQNHYIQSHNQHINPHYGVTDPNPFVPIPISFKNRVLSSSLKKS